MNSLAMTHWVIRLGVTVTCLIAQTKCRTHHLILAYSSRVQSTVLGKSQGGAWGTCPHMAFTVRSQREMNRWAQLSVSLLLRSGPQAVEECHPQRLGLLSNYIWSNSDPSQLCGEACPMEDSRCPSSWQLSLSTTLDYIDFFLLKSIHIIFLNSSKNFKTNHIKERYLNWNSSVRLALMPESSMGFSIIGNKLNINSDASPQGSVQCQPTRAMAGKRCFAMLTDSWGCLHYLQQAWQRKSACRCQRLTWSASLTQKEKYPDHDNQDSAVRDTHLLWAAKGPDGKTIPAPTVLMVGASGIAFTKVTAYLAETDLESSLDGTRCQRCLAFESSLLKCNL